MNPNLKPLITFTIVSVVLIIAALPLIFKNIPPNIAYGFRLQKTLSNPEIWYRANQFGGISVLISCLITLSAYGALYQYRETLAFPEMNRLALGLFLVPLIAAMLLTLARIQKM
jgi:formate hydrogenlyase subunit 3/multisubunit Na+/H+ antiporter MnhD subunit